MKFPTKLISSVLFTCIAFGPVLAATVPDGWTSDLAAAKALAKEKDQKMLMLFTGSDWCIWCKRLKDEILATEAFEKWADDNIVLVYLDYPRDDYRSGVVKAQNDVLAKKYAIRGFPTVVLADVEGKELARLGYMEGGPQPFIREVKKASH